MPTVKVNLQALEGAEACGRCGTLLVPGTTACVLEVLSYMPDPNLTGKTVYAATVRRTVCLIPCADAVFRAAVVLGAPEDAYVKAVAAKRMQAKLSRPLLEIIGRDSQFPHAPPS